MYLAASMRKRSLIACWTAITIFLAGVAVLCYFLFCRPLPEVHKKSSFKVIPADMILMEHFNRFETLAETFADSCSYLSRWTPRAAPMRRFISQFYGWASRFAPHVSDAEALCSLHESGDNTLNLLFALVLPPLNDGPSLLHLFVKNTGIACSKRDYHSKTIYMLSFGRRTLSVAVFRDYLIASTSAVVLESSVRQIESDHSLLDDPVFAALLDKSALQKPVRIFIKNSRLPELVSAFLSRRVQPRVRSCKNAASWILLDGQTDKDLLRCDGIVAATEGEKDYLNIFKYQAPQTLSALGLLPPNTLAFLSLSFSNFDSLLRAYYRYLDVHKRAETYDAAVAAVEKDGGIVLKDWFSLLYPFEVTLACVPFRGGLHYVTLIASHYPNQAKTQFSVFGPQNFYGINANPVSRMPAALLGGIFALNPSSHYCYIDGHVVFSDPDMLASLMQENISPANFTLCDNLKRAKVSDKILSRANLTLFLQPSVELDSLFTLIDKRYAESLDALREYNTQYVVFQIASEQEELYASALVYGQPGSESPENSEPYTAGRAGGAVDYEEIKKR